MSKHIGIVACSAEGAALCYRTICLEASDRMGTHMHPEVSMHTHPLGEYMKQIDANRWEGVADLMLSSAEKLGRIGAEFLICPDNTIHQAFDFMINRSPLPWLHIAEVVEAEARRHEYRRLAILGTKYLMEGPVYREKIDSRRMESRIPSLEQRIEINRVIFEELVNGKFLSSSLSYFSNVIEEMKGQGCDAVVLGCTEIPLLVTQESSALPILDSTRLLARAALQESIL